jgi:hypothetical protein
MNEDVFIRAKKLERENSRAKLDPHPTFFRRFSWKDMVLLSSYIFLEIVLSIVLGFFFEVLKSKIWLFFGILLVITISAFCSFKYFKFKSHRRIKPKHTDFTSN